jgi:putative transcriptional regulator
MDQVTLREFDQLCLPPVEPLQSDRIKHIRETSRVSRAVFARLLNTRLSTVQKWEIGQKKPTGTALELLHLAKSAASKSSPEHTGASVQKPTRCRLRCAIRFGLLDDHVARDSDLERNVGLRRREVLDQVDLDQ